MEVPFRLIPVRCDCGFIPVAIRHTGITPLGEFVAVFYCPDCKTVVIWRSPLEVLIEKLIPSELFNEEDLQLLKEMKISNED